MKRCSQCDFTFDDHQQVCDFDGTELTALPDLPPAFKTVSLAVPQSPVRRLIQSRAGVAILALLGVVASALLVGYFDSLNQPTIDMASNPQTQDAMVSMVPHPSEKSDQAKLEPVAKPRRISTQRKIRADEKSSSKLSSMLKLESAASRSSRSSVASRRGLSTSKLAASTRKRTTTSASKTLATRRKPAKVNQQLTARNHRTLHRRDSNAYRKDSKVVAILKKTGNILTKPFKLLGD
jgi:hypothetical protein